MLMAAPGKSISPAWTIASNTGCVSLSELLITSKDFGGRGLLLQRFGEIVGALAQLVEQPRILDGDDGLSGEVLTPAQSACR